MLSRFFSRSEQRTSAVQPQASSLRVLDQYQYAAIDVETTGLSPKYHHRVVEVGIVLFDLSGTVQGEYESLVNPRRDLGETERIHGLSMADLVHAPAFEDIAHDLGALLRDRVVVAHNARFDMAFIDAELRRAGVPSPSLPHLCTMQLAGVSGHGRRLADICARLSVPHIDAHTAIGDARAAAGVFSRWYQEHPSKTEMSLTSCGASNEPQPDAWPPLTPQGIALARSDASRRAATERGYLGRLIDRLPADADAAIGSEAAYLDVLERALEDRHLSAEEARELAWIAGTERLAANDVRRLHHQFFDALVTVAWQDGVISSLEEADLRLVGEFLAIDSRQVDQAIAAPSGVATGSLESPLSPGLPPGTTVCFTGALRGSIEGVPITREQAHELAMSRGLEVRESVTKKLDVLVVADPQSLSGKARKARDYGTRIVAEAAFWSLIGVATD